MGDPTTTTTAAPPQSTPQGTFVTGSFGEVMKAAANLSGNGAGTETTTETVEVTETTPAGDENETTDETGRGSKTAVLADLSAERDRRQAAEQELTDFKAQVAKLFGVTTDPDAAPTAAELESARQEARAAQVQVAVVRNLPDGVDAPALLDSNAWAQASKELDPSDGAAVRAAIDQFVEANPRFKSSTPARPASSTRDAAARTTVTATKSMDDLIRGI